WNGEPGPERSVTQAPADFPEGRAVHAACTERATDDHRDDADGGRENAGFEIDVENVAPLQGAIGQQRRDTEGRQGNDAQEGEQIPVYSVQSHPFTYPKVGYRLVKWEDSRPEMFVIAVVCRRSSLRNSGSPGRLSQGRSRTSHQQAVPW